MQGLKDAILRVFSDNTLYGSELGHLKQMCEKLTSTLESNMRKVAQFHKEVSRGSRGVGRVIIVNLFCLQFNSIQIKFSLLFSAWKRLVAISISHKVKFEEFWSSEKDMEYIKE